MKIGVISDTHGWLDPQVFEYFKDCDEIWHAGDFGSVDVLDDLESFKPTKGVYGNIDGYDIRSRCPEFQFFEREGLYIFMAHITGKPPRYTAEVLSKVQQRVPDILVGGHSHILQVKHDLTHPPLLYINPGAAGKHGFHPVRTLLRFELTQCKISHMEAIELGPRAAIIF
ncbi:MAG: metallophosphoesterase family protein [Burkholderiales bacterium]